MKKIIFLIAFISIFLNVFLIAFYMRHVKEGSSENEDVDQKALPYLSKRIFLEDQNDMLINFTELRTDITKYVKGVSSHFGIYFEYLPSGVSIGIKEKDSFVLASLLKVPLAMAVYKQYEKGQLSPDTILTIKDTDVNKYFGTLWKRGAGTKISVKEAVRLMLTESDNTAKSVLFNVLPAGAMEEVFDYLDIPKELAEGENTPVVTPKNYSSILRSLYLGSYLNKHNSNDILMLLAQSPFDDKLTAGVPKHISIAHKIGVHEPTNVGKSIYTDCGIVYVPRRPYILCLMIQSNETEAQKRMRDISKIVYAYVSEVNNTHPK